MTGVARTEHSAGVQATLIGAMAVWGLNITIVDREACFSPYRKP